MKFAFRSVLFGTLVAAGLGACTPTIEQRGHLPDEDALAKIKVGETSQDEVLSLLGSPSTVQTYGAETWHYIAVTAEKVAFFDPDIKDRKVVSINFTEEGKVVDIQTRTLEDGQSIDIVARETPTVGKSMGILEQLMGNIGRFSKEPSER